MFVFFSVVFNEKLLIDFKGFLDIESFDVE